MQGTLKGRKWQEQRSRGRIVASPGNSLGHCVYAYSFLYVYLFRVMMVLTLPPFLPLKKEVKDSAVSLMTQG